MSVSYSRLSWTCWNNIPFSKKMLIGGLEILFHPLFDIRFGILKTYGYLEIRKESIATSEPIFRFQKLSRLVIFASTSSSCNLQVQVIRYLKSFKIFTPSDLVLSE
ncbi:hypothetical protein RclHR1_09280001 [Rhizophagus clarus]|uniref:Uncharacterized protein n=1 Tax=Rhizophagus clarus TaxID=94130 RepID=A0A2Z6SH78_9GLOM|nr:hypothetical protein RclHR1_09280001 [Rhizophagus clarus]